MVNFLIVSSFIPVCCLAVERNVTLFAVVHKKLRIKHNLLSVEM